jgi:hypothetical protein
MSLKLFILILVLITPFVGLVLTWFVEYKKLDELESYFSENECVQRNKRFWGRNQPVDKTMRLSVIIGFFTLPKVHVRRGDVTEQELDSVPRGLRCWVTWPFYFGAIWLLACCIGFVWQKW